MKEKTIDKYKTLRDLQTEKDQLNSLVNSCQEEIRQLKKQEKVSYELSKDYKSRIEKADEYIKERKTLNWYADGVFVDELLNILNGRSDE